MKNVTVYRMFVFMLGMCLVSTGYSQQSVNLITKRVQNLFCTQPSELMYFQISKGVYEIGEDLWFKAYQFDVPSFGLSNMSKTLYLQMVNHKDSVVWKEKYPIENGIVSGHLYLDEKLSEGDYTLQGFSKGSFYNNDSIGHIAKRKVSIVKNITRNGLSESQKDATIRFETFPEGGNLVYGLSSKLAFKSTDGKGNPVFCEGIIYQDDKFLCKIKSMHDGMGTVLIRPLLGKKYRIELNNGLSYPLDNILSKGMVMKLSGHDKNQLDFIVSQSDGLPNQQVYLLGQMRGMICCVAKGVLRDSIRIRIPLNNFLYQGIAEFTLYDDSMSPIAERLVYIHPEKKLYITAEPEKKSFTTREKATIKIKINDEEGKPVKANIGISVYDQAYNNPEDPVNILTYCYLSSQIRGKIYNPTYYYDERNNGRKEGIELLLLTQGWRRYVWSTEQSTYQGQPFLTDEINGIQTVKNKSKKNREQNQGTEQLIQISGANGNSQFIWTDSTGHFAVNTEMMKTLRGGYVYLKPMLSKELKPVLKLVDHFPLIDSIRRFRPDYSPIADLSRYNKQGFDLPVISSDSTILLNEVTITGKGYKPFRDKMMGRLDSLAQIKMGIGWVCECKDPSFPYLNDYESGFTHHPVGLSGGGYSGKMLLPEKGKTYRLIKYEPNSNGEWFLTKMKTVVYSGPEYNEEELLRMNNLWRTKGYYASREFYQPDEVDIKSLIPDARNTLLWAPSVITDEKGEATVSFYCSDINTNFLGIVEGADGTGLLGTAKCEFRVLRK